MSMENTWPLEPGLEAFENIAACRNKASQMSERIACYTSYARLHEITWALFGNQYHKYAK